MERPADERPGIPPTEEANAWFRYLELCGAVTPLGEPDDPCRVIGIPDRIWKLGRRSERGVSALAAPAANEQTSHPQASSHPRRPIELIEELRRHYREGTNVLWIADVAVPVELKAIVDRIQRSRSIVDNNESDPDVEPQIYHYATWERAARFLLLASISFWRSKSAIPPTPLITGGPDGSLDIVWREGTRTLYMNIPDEPDNVVTFFGIDEADADLRLRGEEPMQNPGEWLLAWLVR